MHLALLALPRLLAARVPLEARWKREALRAVAVLQQPRGAVRGVASAPLR